MKFRPHPELPEVLIIEPDVHRDDRGHFLELWRAQRYEELGITGPFVQDNMSCSKRGVLRGLHYQLGRPQGKLVWVARGRVFDVAVDIRRGSPTFGKWAGVEMSSEDYRQVYVPVGFAHGFCVLSEWATLVYKCTDYYVPAEERGIRWDDPAVGVDWPLADPLLSEKDRSYPALTDVPAHDLPVFTG